jgi:hypothetical protein
MASKLNKNRLHAALTIVFAVAGAAYGLRMVSENYHEFQTENERARDKIYIEHEYGKPYDDWYGQQVSKCSAELSKRNDDHSHDG